MEQRPVQAMHERHPGRRSLAATIGFAALQLLRQITAARGAGSIVAVRDHVFLAAADAAGPGFFRALASQLLLVLAILCDRGRTMLSANFRHAEHGLPTLKGLRPGLRSGEPETGGGQGPFSPAVVDAGDMPVYDVRGGVTVELVADVDEVLDGCDVDVVDGGEVKDDGPEGGFVGFDRFGSATARARVVPWAILGCVLVNAVRVWGLGQKELTPSLR